MTDQPTSDATSEPGDDPAPDPVPADTGAPDRPQPTGVEEDAPADGSGDEERGGAGPDERGTDRAGTDEAGNGEPGSGARGPGAALAAIAGAPNPPAPPRRTGVFLDHEDLREHVGALLRTFLGGYQVDAWGNFTFTHEDARIFVTVGPSPIGPQIGVFSVTNLDVDLSPQLAGFLLTTNHRLGFGSFSFDPDSDAVWLRHTLLGTTLDGPELQSAVAAVASTAAHFDDVIRDRFGGRAFADAPQDVQDATKPPEPDAAGHPNASGYL